MQPAKSSELTNRLFEGDCLDIMPQIPDNFVDLILCDLPYGTTQNNWDCEIPLVPLWDQYLRIIKDRGAIVLTSQGAFTAKLIMSCVEHFKYKIVWQKSKATNFLNAKRQPLRKHEDICVFYKQHPTYNPQMWESVPYNKGTRKDQLTGSYGDFDPVTVKSDGQRYPTDVIYFKTAESEGEVWHPTQKPVALGQYLIRTYTNPGDVVLDNAFGSGSFIVAAKKENRSYIGVEKNEDIKRYKDREVDLIRIAQQRLDDIEVDNNNVREQKNLFEVVNNSNIR